mgnify:FL=1
MTQLGDISKAKRLCKQFLPMKTLVGQKKGAKVMTCALSLLPSEAQEYIGNQYEIYVRRKAQQQEKEGNEPEQED